MNALTSSPDRLWPRALIAYFAVFISFIVAFIVFATRQQMELVRPDYYDEEMRFQDQLDRLSRTLPVQQHVAITYEAGAKQITVTLPEGQAARPITGWVRLYRPSDARLDRALPLQLSAAGVQHLDAGALRPGLWKVRVTWTVEHEEFFFEQPLVVGMRFRIRLKHQQNPTDQFAVRSAGSAASITRSGDVTCYFVLRC